MADTTQLLVNEGYSMYKQFLETCQELEFSRPCNYGVWGIVTFNDHESIESSREPKMHLALMMLFRLKIGSLFQREQVNHHALTCSHKQL